MQKTINFSWKSNSCYLKKKPPVCKSMERECNFFSFFGETLNNIDTMKEKKLSE